MKIALTTFLLLLTCGGLFAQQGAMTASLDEIAEPSEESNAVAGTNYVIFSNVDPVPGDRYNSDNGFEIQGRTITHGPKVSWAVRFTPKKAALAQVLSAAIQYESGTRLVRLELHTNDELFNTPGPVIPGGEGSTTNIPDDPSCCKLATVVLPGEGVTLESGVPIWLVGTSDDTESPDFQGIWHFSNRASYGSVAPPSPWQTYPGAWPAARISGTRIEAQPSSAVTNVSMTSERATPAPGQVVVFNNLGVPSTERYFNVGGGIFGSNVLSQIEIWQALPFTPRMDVHATTLSAAIGYTSGTRKINLSIFSDDDGKVGTLLVGGQGSTTDIPDDDECCDLATVTLPGAGVALAANQQVWLVASTDDIEAADFSGVWQTSSLAVAAGTDSGFWFLNNPILYAAQILGTAP